MRKILLFLFCLSTISTFSQNKSDEYLTADFIRNYLTEFIDSPIKSTNMDNDSIIIINIESIHCGIKNIDSNKYSYYSDVLIDYNPMIEDIDFFIKIKIIENNKKIRYNVILEVFSYTNEKFYELDDFKFNIQYIDKRTIKLIVKI